MYINFWYPICTSDELTNDAPLRSELLGMIFVAFRDSDGQPHVLADTCVHRGGSLSKGKVVGDCVRCPYHGWQFDGTGKCVVLPSLKSGNPPARAKVDSYPVQERYGIVFAFLGDLPEEERPPLYEIEEYDDPNWREHEMTIINVNCYYERSMENGIDPIHNEFVHPIQGSPQTVPGSVEIHESEWGSGVTSRYAEIGEKRSDEKGMKSNPDELNAGTWTHGPNTLITWITFKKTASLHQYFFEAPIDSTHTRIYFINLRNFRIEPKYDESIREANLAVINEDVDILENLRPARTPEIRTKEILTEGDSTIVRFRDYLDGWQARGWKLDTKTIRDNADDVAYAIPCPDRRTTGNWVLDAAPLEKPATGNAKKAARSA